MGRRPLGRGGGSSEDLWAFNEQLVARAIRASKIPVISAVGHEIDFTIADMAADLRAPTPSAAAEIVARSEAEILAGVERLSADLGRSIEYLLLAAHAELQSLEMSPVFAEFPAKLREAGHYVEGLFADAETALRSRLNAASDELQGVTCRLSPLQLSVRVSEQSKRLSLLQFRAKCAAGEMTNGRHAKVERTMAQLDALSPLGVLTRGYSITQKLNGEIVRDPHQTVAGERVNISLAGGKLEAEVITAADTTE